MSHALMQPMSAWAADISNAVSALAAFSQASNPESNIHTQQCWKRSDAPDYVHVARQKILEATAKIQQAVIQPEEFLQQLAVHVSVQTLFTLLVLLRM